jgi:tRNA pseudouridine38-40 synthase
VAAADAHGDFHPRYDATSRIYRYLIWNRPERSPFWEGRAYHVAARLDERRMDEALCHLVGVRDIGSFVPARATGKRVRPIFAAGCDRTFDLIRITLEASGFMRQMVRAIVGTAIQVGRGSMTVEEFESVVSSGCRTVAGDTAPAHGLYLEKVTYPDRRDRTGNAVAPAVGAAQLRAHEEKT